VPPQHVPYDTSCRSTRGITGGTDATTGADLRQVHPGDDSHRVAALVELDAALGELDGSVASEHEQQIREGQE
jgi:hypothetical protein